MTVLDRRPVIKRSLARELGVKVEMRYDLGGMTCDVDMPFPPANTMAELEVAA